MAPGSCILPSWVGKVGRKERVCLLILLAALLKQPLSPGPEPQRAGGWTAPSAGLSLPCSTYASPEQQVPSARPAHAPPADRRLRLDLWQTRCLTHLGSKSPLPAPQGGRRESPRQVREPSGGWEEGGRRGKWGLRDRQEFQFALPLRGKSSHRSSHPLLSSLSPGIRGKEMGP